VASALGLLDSPREEWDEYDLITKKKLKIEVKSSAYLQSWEQEKLSSIRFGIAPTGTSQVRGVKKVRKSDVYVFCLLSHKEKSTVNPLDLSQWNFYILETKVLNKMVGQQKTIALSSLLQLNPIETDYAGIRTIIKKIEKNANNPSQ
jgi:hypothetical protein